MTERITKTSESLVTLNEVSAVLKRVLQDLELDLEQKALDAKKAGFQDQSHSLKMQSITAYIASTKLQTALHALFMDTLDQMQVGIPTPTPTPTTPATPAVKLELVKSVELPNVTPVAKVVEVFE